MSRLLYGVVRGEAPADLPPGVGGETVASVPEQELVALVGDAPDELLARHRDVTAHMDVLDAAMRSGPVLPFQFGTVLDDDDRVRAMLRERQQEWVRSLHDLAGLVQLTLSISYDEDAVVRSVVGRDPRLRDIARRSAARSVADRIAAGERVAAAIDRQCQADRQLAVRTLEPLVRGLRVSEEPGPVLAAALLVETDEVPATDQAVAGLVEQLGERASVDYAGPMPAYSFVA